MAAGCLLSLAFWALVALAVSDLVTAVLLGAVVFGLVVLRGLYSERPLY